MSDVGTKVQNGPVLPCLDVLGAAGIELIFPRSWLADPSSQSNGIFYNL